MKPADKIREARDVLFNAKSLDEAKQQFRWPEITGKFNWAIDWFDEIGRGREDCALLICDFEGYETRYSYAELVDRSDQVASWFNEIGVQKGDPIIMMLGNQVELWDSMLAAMKIGAVIIPTAQAVNAIDLADRTDRGNVKVVIANEIDSYKFDEIEGEYLKILADGSVREGWLDLHEAYQRVPKPMPVVTEVDDPCIEYFTSGTTQLPKLVEHSQLSYPVGHLTTAYFIGCRQGDIHLNISSPGWGKHAWSSFFSPWIAEATICALDYDRFDAAKMIDLLRQVKINTFCAPPTVWRMMLQTELGECPEGLRELVGAGEPLNPEVIGKIQDAWGLTIRDGFGQTETTCQIGNAPGEPVKPGSMGRPLPGVPIVILDADHNPANEGEICIALEPIRPLNLMTRYIGDAALQREIEHHGYYHTGDLATVDNDGYITYVGRSDDVFKASDYKISPFELESVLIEHPAVLESAVVPSPDPVRMAVPKAYIKLVEGIPKTKETALSILEYAKENLSAYLRIRKVSFIDELPKTVSQKIRRVVLRLQEADPKHVDDNEFRYQDFPELSTRNRNGRPKDRRTGQSRTKHLPRKIHKGIQKRIQRKRDKRRSTEAY